MPKYVLHYFDVTGRADPLRLLFNLAGVEFEDRRFISGEWPELKKNDKLFPYAQVPVLEVDGTVIAESGAIARFLANEFGFSGKTNLEKAKCDMLIDGLVTGLGPKLNQIFLEKDEAKKAEHKKEFLATTLYDLLKLHQDKFFPKEGFFIGDSVSSADICYLCMMNRCQEQLSGNDIFENLPLAKEFHERIKNVPKIKSFLDSQKK